MTLKDIIETAAELLKLEADLENGDDPETRLLVRVANLVLGEIAGEYVPLYHTQVFHGIGERGLSYAQFEKIPVDVKTVESGGGRRLKFRQYPDRLALKAETAIVTYTYLPAYKALLDTIEYSGGKVPPRVFGYGIAGEYCLISGRYDESEIWTQKYRDALRACTVPATELTVPARPFI